RRRAERLRSHFDDEAGMSISELRSLARDNDRSPDVIELYNTASAEATNRERPAHAHYAESYESIIASSARYLQQAADRGLLREGWTPETAARAMLGTMDGQQLQWLYGRDDVHVADTLKLLVSALIAVPLSELD